MTTPQREPRRASGTLHLSINLDRPIADLQKALRSALAKASVGLHSADQFTGSTDLPGIFPALQLGSPLDAQEAKRLYVDWLHSMLLRDGIEALEVILCDVWMLATIPTLTGPDQLVHSSSLARFNTDLRKFRDSKTLGQKVAALNSDFPELITPPWLKVLNGLLALRNCLTHGGGIVREKDLTSPKRLIVSWRALQVLYVGPDGTVTLLREIPQQQLPGGHLGVRTTWKRRQFKLGERPILTRQELSELLLSLLFFAQDLRASLLRHLQAAGLAPKNLDLTPKFDFVAINLQPLIAGVEAWAQEVETLVGPLEIYLRAPLRPPDDQPLQVDLALADTPDREDLFHRHRTEWEKQLSEQLGLAVVVEPYAAAPRSLKIYPRHT